MDGNTTVIENSDKGLTQDQFTLKALQSILEIFVHKYIQELKLPNYPWDVIKVKLRERFSDCTSPAATQN